MQPSVQAIICGFIGVLVYCFIKLNTLSADARSANIQFNPVKDYLVKDMFSIGLSVLMVLAWYLLFPEATTKYPALANFVKCSFFFMGGMGSWGIQLIFGRAKKQIRAIIDAKTTIADGTDEANTPLSKQAAKDIAGE